MKFLNKLFSKKANPEISKAEQLTISEFWNWFSEKQTKLLQAVKSQNNIQSEFISPVFNKLNQIQEGAFLLTGMMDDNTAELVFTAEGDILSFPYISELVSSAPQLKNWQFTAFKPSVDIPDFSIDMGPKSFSTDNIFFYPENDDYHPDEISIKLCYTDKYTDDENQLIENGTFIFLENYLGEIKTATQIDRLSFNHNVNSNMELNPISKLNDYINWREKEFIEKYEGTFHNSDESNYSSLEWEKGDRAIVGVVNSDLIKWDKKASHPWIMVITIEFDENENNGMPTQELLQSYYQFEDRLRELLPDKEGYIHVAQTTGLGKREIYYANKNYTRPIQILNEMKDKVSFDYVIEVFKDKYWKSMKLFEH
ncbi:DUF695 domain-containing protein [Saprospiraceae bacterium]|nr:DUF695 domain-containing protein [Saprospiraceae bacterium]